MEITLFAKKVQSNDGKTFYKFLSTLNKKDGETVSVQVKFREPAKLPAVNECPMNIKFNKTDANYVVKSIDRNGEKIQSRVLWVSSWTPGKPYIDNSMDEFV